MHWAGVALVLVASVALRFIGLHYQSLCPDEYNTYCFDSSGTLSEYLALNAFRLPDNLPVYPVVLWGWLRVVGFSVLHARLLAVCLGLGSALLVFALGRRLGGYRCGLFACMLYALSPLCLFHDQAVRPYPLFMFLALLSVWVAFHFREEAAPGKWLLASVVVNVLLVYTHLIGAMLLLVEGLYLCWLWRRRSMLLAAWALPQLCLVVPAPLLIGVPDVDPYFPPMEFGRFVENLINQDTVDFSVELIASRDNWGFTLVGYDNFRMATHVSTLVLLALAVAGVVRVACSSLPDRKMGLLLIGVFLLPGSAVYVASQFVDPMSMPRYTLYSNAARLLLAAYGFTWIPRVWVWAPLLVVLGIIQGAQLSALLPYGARSEHVRAGEVIRANATPQDEIVTAIYPDVLYVHFPLNADLDVVAHRLLSFQLGTGLPVHAEHSMAGMASKAASLLEAVPAGQKNVWLVLIRNFDESPIEGLEKELARRGLSFERRHYYGFDGLTVYKVRAQGSVPNDGIPAAPAYDALALLQGWGVAVPESQAQEARMSMARSFDGPPTDLRRPGDYSAIAFTVGKENPQLGIAVASAGITRFPDAGTLYLVRAVLALMLCNRQAAEADLAKARPLLRKTIVTSLGAVMEDLSGGRYREAGERIERLQALSEGSFDPLFERAALQAAKCNP